MQNTWICNLSMKPSMESICWQQGSNTLRQAGVTQLCQSQNNSPFTTLAGKQRCKSEGTTRDQGNQTQSTQSNPAALTYSPKKTKDNLVQEPTCGTKTSFVRFRQSLSLVTVRTGMIEWTGISQAQKLFRNLPPLHR